MSQKHHLSHIHPDARIADSVKIDPFVTIQEDVEIGEDCWIGSNVVIHAGARIGNGVKIFPGAVISSIPQDLKYAGEETTVEIGDRTVIREFATINRGTSYSGKTVVGSDALLMAYSHVAHDCVIGDHAIIANAVNLAGHVVVGDYAIIGGLSAIHQFVRIGNHCILAGGSLAGKDIPPYTKAARYPLAYAGVNVVGLRRRGFSGEQIEEIKEIYRVMYLSGKNVTQGLKSLENDFDQSPLRDEIIEFVRSSDRGLMKGYDRMNGHSHEAES